jgi:hypothetical protein
MRTTNTPSSWLSAALWPAWVGACAETGRQNRRPTRTASAPANGRDDLSAASGIKAVIWARERNGVVEKVNRARGGITEFPTTE